MNKYYNRLEAIKKDWKNFLGRSFESETGELSENKNEKSKIKEFIVLLFNDSELNISIKQDLINRAIILLAEFSGCAEDLEISEEILDILIERNIIDKSHIDLFYDNSSSNRWY